MCVLQSLYMTTLKPMTKLTKTFTNGTISVWLFGQLSNGQFAAKNGTGKKMVFPSLEKMDQVITKFQNKYGYTKPSVELVKQLSLAV